MARLGCMHYFRLVSSCVGVAVGLSASFVFADLYHHTVAGLFGFLSAIFAAVCLMLHVLHHRGVLETRHSPETLDGLMRLGFCVFVIHVGITLWYIFEGLYHHRAIMPVEDSPYISAVWTFMTAKWGFLLWSCSRTYSGLLNSSSEDSRSSLLPHSSL